MDPNSALAWASLIAGGLKEILSIIGTFQGTEGRIPTTEEVQAALSNRQGIDADWARALARLAEDRPF